MKIQVFKYTSGLSQIQVDERLLIDGATGRTWQGHTTELAQVVKALQGWESMKIAGMVVGVDPASGPDRSGTWYGESYREF
ncbi:hypothetical protein EVC26_025 [Rhizobium phage RHph_I72]|nr:hypothetical protein EVC26_025 [Rhizobium phage RHph_I72]